MHAGVRISSADRVRVGDIPPRLMLDLYRRPSTPYSFMFRGGRSAMTVRVIGAALSAYGKPTSVVFAQRGIWAALALGVLTKQNRSRTSCSRKNNPTK